MLFSTFLKYRRIPYICPRMGTISVNTISHVCMGSLRGIITIPIFKGGCPVGIVPDPASKINFVSNDWGDDQTEEPIVEDQFRSHDNRNKSQEFHDEQYLVVFVHAFRRGLNILKQYSCLVVRIPFSKNKKDKIHGKNTSGKESPKKLYVFSKKGRNNHGQKTCQASYNFEGMSMLVVFKLLKKPIHLLLRMVVLGHLSSLKILINSRFIITFSTNCTK